MGRLTTHVLDTAHGRPAAGMRIELFRLGKQRERVAATATNADGRCERPLLEGQGLAAGFYELVFHAGDYFTRLGLTLATPQFLDQVTVRFGVANPAEHYHVPLLISPYAYSTYRGS